MFLRELVSNASDACDKLRYAALTDASLAPAADLAITLEIDTKAKTLSIYDNGIGMNHADLLETLGTIAKSGTGAFIEALKAEEKDAPGLIGQFGVGFYSAFMVSNQVDVLTRKAGETEAWLWSSDGKGSFTIEPAQRENPGTTVTLHLKKDAKEFAEEARIRHIIKTYSEHISFPVKLGDETLNAAEALWTRPAKDITEEQYTEFYRHSSHAFDTPWHVIHNKVEGTLNHTSLLFIGRQTSLAQFHRQFDARRAIAHLLVVFRFLHAKDDALKPAIGDRIAKVGNIRMWKIRHVRSERQVPNWINLAVFNNRFREIALRCLD